MPVTVIPSPDKVGTLKDRSVVTSHALLEASSKAWTTNGMPRGGFCTNKKNGKEDRNVLKSSFEDHLDHSGVVPYGNGFVTGIIRAFNQDLHLILRPDDVWLAILTQFSMYINGHAEEMRPFLVSHEGKKKVVIDVRPSSLADVDMGKMAFTLTKEVQKHIVDPELQEWMVPRFTTTTETDIAVTSFVMLGSLKHYFEYVLRGGCGFPSVTLLGEQSDWESIVIKARNLARYGAETTEWARLLDPVLRHMVSSFESPDSFSTRDFWMRACYQAGREGSGAKATLSGWITAFCLWNEDGKRNGVYTIERLEDEDRNCGLPVVDRRQLVLDGVPYPLLSQDSVPKAFVYIPLVLEDYETDTEYTATVVAGHVGVAVTEERTTVQPLSGWWMLQDSMKPSSR